jgi:hypothetical protein
LLHPSKSALGLTHPPKHWTPGVKRLGPGVNQYTYLMPRLNKKFFFTLYVFMTGYWVKFISTGVPMLAVEGYGSGNLIFGTR